ncbi:MAG: hypothetical protein ABSE73_31075, partial [Planctomycetota bacterium]
MTAKQGLLVPLVLLSSLCLLPSCDSSRDSGSDKHKAAGPISKRLRGYGTLKVSFQTLESADGAYDLWTFGAENREKASITIGKLLADLTLSPGVRREELEIKGRRYPLISVAGGASYSGFVVGNTGYVVSTGSASGLKNLLQTPETLGIKDASKIVTALKYPQYLDRFDRYGWGFYGVEAPGTAEQKEDPAEDLAFCAQNNFRIEMWPQPANHADSFSVTAWEAMGWRTKEAERLGIPLSARLYGGGGMNILPIRKELAELHQLRLEALG